MKAIRFEEFNNLYQEVVRSIYKYWTPEMQKELADHNHAWGEARFDFGNYLRASSERFYRAYRSVAEKVEGRRVCDVGGFWGVFAVTLKKLGYDVVMTESLRYYGDSLKVLLEHIVEEGVPVVDYDPFGSDQTPIGRFDVVTLLAVLEHYPHSLKTFMQNIVSIMRKGGSLYIEVPNIAYWPKRVKLLFGRSPLVPLDDIMASKVPFIGHHHEFSISELRELVSLSGLSIVSEWFYNYSPGSIVGPEMLLRNPIQLVAFLLCQNTRECLAVLCKRRDS